MPDVQISVIIPTHNRRESLLRTLDSLCRQALLAARFEVIVVADGCSDGTLAAVTAFAAPYRLACIDQPAQGPATARNHGAQQAAGSLLVFLDDDIETWPGLLAAHLAAHGSTANRAVIGYLPTILADQQGYFCVELQGWWENMFTAMRTPGYRFRYSDLLTGNFSLPAAVFRQAGGFNTSLRCHEDYELGYRLIQTGIELVFAPAAGGYHHERTLLQRSLDRKVQEGQADVYMARLHPDLLPALQLFGLRGYGSPLQRRFYHLAFDAPRLGDWLARRLQGSLPRMERLGLRGRWRNTLSQLLVYWYLRGVNMAVGNRTAWHALISSVSPEEERPSAQVCIDLAQGIPAAELVLDETRPQVAAFIYGSATVGCTRAAPGSEPLRGRHLRRLLREELGWELAGAVCPAQVDPAAGDHQRLMAALFQHWREEQ